MSLRPHSEGEGSPKKAAAAYAAFAVEHLSIAEEDRVATNKDKNTNDGPLLVRVTSTSQIYRLGKRRGIKVPLPSSGPPRLENERRATDALPPSCPRRNVVRLEGGVGRWWYALHFDWVDGVTLEDWLGANRGEWAPAGRGKDHWRTRIRVAAAVARTLKVFHEAGVVHNNLSCANIILDFYRKGEGDCVATLIGLSRSVIYSDSDSNSAAWREARRSDLGGLGRVFQALFGDIAENKNSVLGDDGGLDHITNGGRGAEEAYSPRNDHIKRGKSSTEEQRAMEGVPLYLSFLIDALMLDGSSHNIVTSSNTSSNGSSYNGSSYNGSNNTNKDNKADRIKYESVGQVLSDLDAALSEYDVYFRSSLDNWTSIAAFPPPVPPDAFYGRRAELSVLTSSLNSALSSGQIAVSAVSGHAGMGKTRLVNQIRKAVGNRGGYVIWGKFEISSSGDRCGHSVLYRALDSFFDRFAKAAVTELRGEVRDRIVGSVGFGLGELIQSIPNLSKLVGNTYKTRDLSVVSRQHWLHRWKFLLCKLFKCISDTHHPIVLVLDDLQWCDETTLDLIRTIIVDPDITHCLCVGCYRDDNEAATRAVTEVLDAVRGQGVNVYKIHLGPFERESTNVLISESICLPPILTRPLSAIIHGKTAGSPLFIKSFLQSLKEDGSIHFNLTTRRWEYKIENIMAKEVPEEIVEYMKMQMTKLPPSHCLVLKLASCLGHKFDYITFCRAEIKQGYKLETVLPSVCQAGYIQEISPGVYKWAHDQMQLAAHKLIPPNMLESFHLLIGSRLLMNTPEDELKSEVFSILGHMNMGIHLIQSANKMEQMYELARLNLLAGDQSVKTSSFDFASNCYMNGTKLLPNDCWETEYNLTLSLHEGAQEALFATGDFSTLRIMCDKALLKGKTFDDKLNSYHNLVRYFASSGQLDEGINLSLRVLDGLGEALPTEFKGEEDAMNELSELVKEYSEDQILALPQMTDKRKLVAMEFLQNMLTASVSKRPELGPNIVAQMVTISLACGLCDVSAFAFAGYASWLIREDFEGGYRYGYLSIKLLERFGGDRFKPRVICVVYSIISMYREPIQSSLHKLIEGYNAAYGIGDIEFAFWNIHANLTLALFSGQNLVKLQRDMEVYAKKAIQCNQTSAALSILPLLAAAIEFTGDASKGNVYVAFLGTTEDAIIQQLQSQNQHFACILLWNCRKYSSTLKGDMNCAAEILDKNVSSLFLPRVRSIQYIMSIFVDGLIAFFMARKHGQDKHQWSVIGEGAIKTMKKLTYQGSKWNFSNKLYLLEAEYFFLQGNDQKALEKYTASISAAQLHRFLNEEGLALEKAAHWCLHIGKNDDALNYFSEATACYERWGARSLVNRIRDVCGIYLGNTRLSPG